MKIRSVETALRADVSQNVPNGVDALGIFDNLVFHFQWKIFQLYFHFLKWKVLQCIK